MQGLSVILGVGKENKSASLTRHKCKVKMGAYSSFILLYYTLYSHYEMDLRGMRGVSLK
ncbi:hypothetical protein O9A_01303 [Bartonella koehlerae C-29]|uniref:Uncharacterized protein n=1 Tax=Bartonella koehlerae C-29 TaxID=1134510 RepID=A0A067W4N3_9HYPH|nr:hypothetical protein O9A_01303 [Bartonella koehlerae C-29]